MKRLSVFILFLLFCFTSVYASKNKIIHPAFPKNIVVNNRPLNARLAFIMGYVTHGKNLTICVYYFDVNSYGKNTVRSSCAQAKQVVNHK